MIYHVTTEKAWDQAKATGSYEVPSLVNEGFIHCSSSQEQVEGVLGRYYTGQKNLVKLEIDPEKLVSQLVYEWSPSVEDTFPHVYGPINLSAVEKVTSVEAPAA